MLQWEAAAALPLLLFSQVDRARTPIGAWHHIVIPLALWPCLLIGYGSVSLVSSAQKKLWSKSPLMAFCDMRQTLVQCLVLYFLGKYQKAEKTVLTPTTVLSISLHLFWWAHWRWQGLNSWWGLSHLLSSPTLSSLVPCISEKVRKKQPYFFSFFGYK